VKFYLRSKLGKDTSAIWKDYNVQVEQMPEIKKGQEESRKHDIDPQLNLPTMFLFFMEVHLKPPVWIVSKLDPGHESGPDGIIWARGYIFCFFAKECFSTFEY
jgi:hypothetical protein